MKTRIISGIVMGIIVAAVLVAGFLWNSYAIIVAVALLAGVAVFELLHNAVGIKSHYILIGAVVYVVVNNIFPVMSDFSLIFGILYFIYAAIGCLKNHKEFSLAQICGACFAPAIIAMAFALLNLVIIGKNDIYYLLLLFNFSSVCDMGAYFVGVTMGKHKLCPEISPKKTVEGAIGGIFSSIIVTVILSVCLEKALLIPIILTVPLCILGMLGDLFASAIKRSVDLKDYGNLIPGHGGILDRLDSILMISPVLAILMLLGVI